MRRPVVCVVSEIPKLYDVLQRECSQICAKVTTVDPKAVKPSDGPLLQEAEVIISEPHRGNIWLNDLPNLKLVHGTWAGVDSMMKLVDEQKITPKFTYCRFGGRFGQSMSEYVLAYIVAQERNFRMTYEAQAQSNWSQSMTEYIWYNTRNLDTLTIGILGLGDIGKKVAKVCKAVGMKVWGLVNTIPNDELKCSYVDEYRTSTDLDTLLSNCDYVCSVLPSTPQTRGMLDNDRFKACSNKQSVFINVGRGDICSEQSIMNALEQGWLRGAVLDVMPVEPLPSSSLLWKQPTVTITPHVAAVYNPTQIATLIIENLENYVNERPLQYAIDWSKGY